MSFPHDGISVMPGSPTGHGNGSPTLQTMLVLESCGTVLSFSTWIDAGRPVAPATTAVGKVGVAPAPSPASATPDQVNTTDNETVATATR